MICRKEDIEKDIEEYLEATKECEIYLFPWGIPI